MIDGLNIGLNIGIYDGDTSQENRKLIRDYARLVSGHKARLAVFTYYSVIL